MSNTKLTLVPVERTTALNTPNKSNARKGRKMLLGTYAYKVSDAAGQQQWKIVNIPDEIY